MWSPSFDLDCAADLEGRGNWVRLTRFVSGVSPFTQGRLPGRAPTLPSLPRWRGPSRAAWRSTLVPCIVLKCQGSWFGKTLLIFFLIPVCFIMWLCYFSEWDLGNVETAFNGKKVLIGGWELRLFGLWWSVPAGCLAFQQRQVWTPSTWHINHNNGWCDPGYNVGAESERISIPNTLWSWNVRFQGHSSINQHANMTF